MFDSRVIDVVLALCAVYALLALGCSWVAEWIGALLELRAKTLERSITELLSTGHERGATVPKAVAVFEHSLVAPLASRGWAIVNRTTPRPSCIPSWILARALWDIAVRPAEDGRRSDVSDLANSIKIPVLRLLALSAIREGRSDIKHVRADIEKYIDAQMERARGWYARSAQLVVIGVAVLMTLLLNIDSVAIARRVWSDEGARTAAIQLAQHAADLPAATASDAVPDPGAGSPPTRPSEQGLDALVLLVGAPLPIGWHFEADAHDLQSVSTWTWSLGGQRLAGWFATVIAISLGAPFWFGLVNRLIGLRLGGSSPQPSQPAAVARETQGT